jgi:hypothetical protein
LSAVDEWQQISNDATDAADPASLYVVLGFRALQLLAGILYAAHLHDAYVKPQLALARDMLPTILNRIQDLTIPDIPKMVRDLQLERASVPVLLPAFQTRRRTSPRAVPVSSQSRRNPVILSARGIVQQMPMHADQVDADGMAQPWVSLAEHTHRLATLYKRVTDILVDGLMQLEGLQGVRAQAAPVIRALLAQPPPSRGASS